MSDTNESALQLLKKVLDLGIQLQKNGTPLGKPAFEFAKNDAHPESTRLFHVFSETALTFIPNEGVPRLVRSTACDLVQNLCYVLEQIPADQIEVRKTLQQGLRLWKPDIKIRTPEEVRAELDARFENIELPW